MRTRVGGLVLLLAMIMGCGGGEQVPAEEAGSQETGAPAMAEAPAGEAMALEEPTGAIDTALASAGEGYFQSRGCVGCHQLSDERMVGPGMKGVTERRTFQWFVAIVVNPDSMLQNDPDTQALYQEYGTPMVAMGTTGEEARAIYEYLRANAQ